MILDFGNGRMAQALPADSLPTERVKSRFLDGLPRQVREKVLAAATIRTVVARSIVTNQEDPANHLFLIKKGSARHFVITPEGQKLLLLWLAPGNIFGGSALLLHHSTYLVSTEVVEDSSVAVWSRDAIRGLAAKYPSLLENAMAVATEYLTWYVASHSALASRTARQRLARVLTSLAVGLGRKVPDGIELNLNNEELADSANVASFTASRLLSDWQRRGILVKSRGKLVVRNLQRLWHPQR